MVSLIIQTILLFAIAFVLGCVAGCLLRRAIGHKAPKTAATTPLPTPAPPQKPSREPETPALAADATPKMPVPPMPVAAVSTATTAEKAAETTISEANEASDAGPKDNLRRIRGIGPQNEKRLNALGVRRYEQIAAWRKKDVETFGEALNFPGRIEREDWVGQAKVLAKGGSVVPETAPKERSTRSKPVPQETGTRPDNLLDAPRDGKGDNLTLIDGVGNVLEKKLFRAGIYHFDQLASLSPDELVWLGREVGFPGRPEREDWPGESKILAEGGMTEHARKVERGEIKTSRKSGSDES